MISTLLEQITDVSGQVLQGSGLFVIDIEIKGNETKYIISVFVDSEQGGVNIDQCAKVSREMIFLIESHEYITGKFTLNVSSPGLDRPLKDRRQFNKNIGRKAAVKFTSDSAVQTLKGTLTDVADAGIVVMSEKGQSQTVSWQDLIETKILPAF